MDVVMDALIETRSMELLARCIQTKTGQECVTGDGFTVQNSPREWLVYIFKVVSFVLRALKV